jgi:hypothetical protein
MTYFRASNIGGMVAGGLLLAGSVACGSNGSTAVLRVMDAPPQGVTAVKVFVATAGVHVVDADGAKGADPADTSIDKDSQWQSLDLNQAIDLMAHQGEGAAALLGELPLPQGKITQIRLVLDTTQPQIVTQNGVDCAMDTSQVPPTGIKINHPFKAFDSKDGARNEILMDFDLGESLKASGGCFRLEPVIKLVKVKADGKDVEI